MSERYVVGIDNGTGGCKVTFLRPDGTIAAESYTPYASHYEHPRWVEQDPDDWVRAAFDGVAACLRSLGAGAAGGVEGIAFSAPHHTAVLLDEHDRLIRRAILWNDQRSDAESSELMEQLGEEILRVAHNAAAPTWTLPQLRWLQKHRPAEHARIHSILFMKDYVRWRFTGEKCTDHIDAGGSLFFDIVDREWSPTLLAACGLDVESMPAVLAPTARAGAVTAAAAERTGLRAGTPVVVGTADSAAEVYGAGGVRLGDVTLKLATAGNVQSIRSEPASGHGVISYEHPIDGLYYVNSATNFAAASFRWFRETFFAELSDEVGIDGAHAELNRLIEAVPLGAEGTIFLPFLNGERSPYWDPHLRGAFLGLTNRHGRPEMARAVMEGVALSLRDAAASFGDLGGRRLRLIGGGSHSAAWRQIVADIMDAEIVVPASTEASFGTCLLGAVGVGWFPDALTAAESTQRVRALVAPVTDNVPRYEELFHIYREAARSVRNVSHALTRFAEEPVETVAG